VTVLRLIAINTENAAGEIIHGLWKDYIHGRLYSHAEDIKSTDDHRLLQR